MPQLLLSWWNLIFELPFGLGLLYLAVYTLSGWTFGEAGADGAMEHDVDASMDADGHVSFEHDVDADTDADTDTGAEGHDTDQDHTGGGSALMAALNFIGVGRAPLSMVLMILMLSWGTIGFCTNRLMDNRPLDQSVPAAIVIAGLGSIFITKFVSSLVARFLPTTESYARRRHELLGSLAEALYPIDAKFGMAVGRDDRGERFEVACRTEADQPIIPKGSPVQLVGYAAKERMFCVVLADKAETPRVGKENRG